MFLVTRPHRLSGPERASTSRKGMRTHPKRMPPKAAMTQLMMTYPVTRASMSICNKVTLLSRTSPTQNCSMVAQTPPYHASSGLLDIYRRPAERIGFLLVHSCQSLCRLLAFEAPCLLQSLTFLTSLHHSLSRSPAPFEVFSRRLLSRLLQRLQRRHTNQLKECSPPEGGLANRNATAQGKYQAFADAAALNRYKALLDACSRPDRRIMYYISCPAGLRSASDLNQE